MIREMLSHKNRQLHQFDLLVVIKPPPLVKSWGGGLICFWDYNSNARRQTSRREYPEASYEWI